MPKSIEETAKTDDRRATLVAMRDKLAADMDVAMASVVAQIAARLQAVLAEIDEIAQPKGRTLQDELEQRRADRLAKTKPSASAKRSAGQRG